MTMPSPYIPPPVPTTRVSRAWAVVPVVTLGILSFVPFLRIAIAQKSQKDWAVFGAYLAVCIGLTVAVGSVPAKGPGGAALGGLIVLLIVAATVHASIELRSLPQYPRLTRPVGVYPAVDPVTQARARIQQRVDARKLAETDPVLARELRIGRPDLPRQFDDGGLVDINNVPAQALMACLQFSEQEANAVIAARDRIGRFSSPEEVSVYAQLAPARVDGVRDLMWFG